MRLDELKRPLEILIIDENKGNVRSVCDALRSLHIQYNSRVKENGEEALMHLQTLCRFGAAPLPDVIFLDLNLPRIDGGSILDEIKADPDLRKVPVVFFSSQNQKTVNNETWNDQENFIRTERTSMDSFVGALRQVEKFLVRRDFSIRER
ncbi:MAG TPA: response regulator [Bacteroidota bacterium]